MRAFTTHEGIADNGTGGAFVLGAAVEAWHGVAFETLPIEARIDGIERQADGFGEGGRVEVQGPCAPCMQLLVHERRRGILRRSDNQNHSLGDDEPLRTIIPDAARNGPSGASFS